MPGSPFSDHYETLQLSPNADFRTIEQVFRSLARQFHPDNPETGNEDHFRAVVEAFETLSDPERRAKYDVEHSRRKDRTWKMMEHPPEVNSFGSDDRIRHGILEILYRARRYGEFTVGVGIMELEHLIGSPEAHLQFHFWYLKEKGWIARMDSGELAITIDGVDEYVSRVAGDHERKLLASGQSVSENAAAAGPTPNGD